MEKIETLLQRIAMEASYSDTLLRIDNVGAISKAQFLQELEASPLEIIPTNEGRFRWWWKNGTRRIAQSRPLTLIFTRMAFTGRRSRIFLGCIASTPAGPTHRPGL